MFFGEVRCALDEKGRLNFPAKYRGEMGGQFFITRWLDNCLIALPKDAWDEVSGRLMQLDLSSLAKQRETRRFLFSGAEEVSPDKQGRVLLSEAQRRHATLSKDVVVAGMGDYIEIWDAAAWDALLSGFDNAEIARRMEGQQEVEES